MRLVWHIAKKDLRRMALPIMLWIAFIVATAIWFRLASPGSGHEAAPGIVGWLPMMGVWTRLLVGGQFVIGYLLAGALIIEDPLVGADNFWNTRPIGNARLLVAKLLAAILLFVVVPVVALAMVWLSSGFTLREAWLAGCEFAFWPQGLVALSALAVASLTKNLVQFLFCSVALFVAYVVCSAYGVTAPFIATQEFPIRQSRNLLVQGGLWPAVAIVLVHQFITRRTGRTWLVIVGLLTACFAIRVAWPIDVRSGSAGDESRARSENSPHHVTMTVERISLGRYLMRRSTGTEPVQANVTLVMSPATAPDGSFYAPATGAADVRWPNGWTVDLSFRRGGAWGEAAAMHAILGQSEAPGRWNIYGRNDRSRTLPVGEAKVEGRLEVWLTKPRVFGELQKRMGTEFSYRASRTRVISVESPPGWEMALVIEEHDAELTAVDGWQFENMNRLAMSEGKRDVFVLANRAAQRAEIIRHDELGSVSMNAQVIGFRRLYIRSATDGEDWRRDATILKVRLTREGRLWRTFAVHASVVDGARRP